jgi:hypothetical protein
VLSPSNILPATLVSVRFFFSSKGIFRHAFKIKHVVISILFRFLKIAQVWNCVSWNCFSWGFYVLAMELNDRGSFIRNSRGFCFSPPLPEEICDSPISLLNVDGVKAAGT